MIDETEKASSLSALNNHPLVKRVTSEQMVHRTLKFFNGLSDSNNSSDSESENGKIHSASWDCESTNCLFHSWRNNHRGTSTNPVYIQILISKRYNLNRDEHMLSKKAVGEIISENK